MHRAGAPEMASKNRTGAGEFERGTRSQELIGGLGRPLLNAGLDRLPNRLQWTAMTLVGIKVPDYRPERLWERGVEKRDGLLEHARSVHPDVAIDGARVLEIGCGPGRILVPMAAAGADAHGIDVSPVSLDRCRRFARDRGVDVTLATAESDVPFEGPFDFVYSVAVFMHLPRKTAVEYLMAARRSLADGGVGCFTFRDLDHPESRRKFREDLHKRYSTRVRFHTAEEVRNFMQVAGFEDVTVVRDHAEAPRLVAVGR